jgi:Trypsin-co-occurring domain 1
MNHVVALPLAEGGSIKVEVDEAPLPRPRAGPVTRSGRPTELASTAAETFEQALDGVAPAARALVSKLRGTADPSEITLEFSLKVSADAGVVVARTGGEANFGVTLKWKATE